MKRLIFKIVVLVCSLAVCVSSSYAGMNLKQKKLVQKIEADVVKIEKKLETYSGKKIDIEVDYNSFFAIEKEADRKKAFNFIKSSVLNPIKDAIESLCRDKMGKEAVQNSLMKIVIINDSKLKSSKLAFKDSTLTETVDMKDSIMFIKNRTDIIKFLEENI